MNARDTAKGIGIRALILIAGIIVVGICLVWLAFEIAGAAIQLMVWLALALIAAAAIAIFARRFRR